MKRTGGPTRFGKWREFLIAIILVPLIPLLLLMAPFLGALWILDSVWLGFQVRWSWYPRGKRPLFVYSDSSNWKEYIEKHILWKIREQAVVMNWSQRSQWDRRRNPLEVRIFEHWSAKRGAVKEFNPMAVVFVPWWRPRMFRFWQAFKEFRNGRDRSLRSLEVQLLDILRPALLR